MALIAQLIISISR